MRIQITRYFLFVMLISMPSVIFSQDWSSSDPFLQGNFNPIDKEIEEHELTVIGEIPKELNGIYMRNGPNPKYKPIAYNFPFNGDGMVHAVYLNNGKASYKNKYILTNKLKAEIKVGKALPFSKNVSNIKVIKQGDSYLSLYEHSPPYEISSDLETNGFWKPSNVDDNLSLNAHTRLDVETGEQWFFSYNYSAPHLNFYCIDKNSNLIKHIPVDKPLFTMMHDFALTKNYIVIFDHPTVPSRDKVNSVEWQPLKGMRIGIIPRKGNANNVRWIKINPFFVYHFSNSYEVSNQIVIDYIRYEKLVSGETIKQRIKPDNGNLWRSVINLDKNTVKHKQMFDDSVEFPTINESLNGSEYNYVYMSADSHKNALGVFDSLVKCNLSKNTKDIINFGNNAEISEALFVPRINADLEDDGYLLLFVYYKDSHSEFLILDAKNISKKPLARVILPQRVPYGFHASWFPRDTFGMNTFS